MHSVLSAFLNYNFNHDRIIIECINKQLNRKRFALWLTFVNN